MPWPLLCGVRLLGWMQPDPGTADCAQIGAMVMMKSNSVSLAECEYRSNALNTNIEQEMSMARPRTNPRYLGYACRNLFRGELQTAIDSSGFRAMVVRDGHCTPLLVL